MTHCVVARDGSANLMVAGAPPPYVMLTQQPKRADLTVAGRPSTYVMLRQQPKHLQAVANPRTLIDQHQALQILRFAQNDKVTGALASSLLSLRGEGPGVRTRGGLA